ncbi:MAG: glycosyltransferase family 2 protein [Candidatus Levybacteria bacterium]|nr:glycosyltransferase family 2 protein [Candidatus Levybacteria bacterium]MBP9814772.1 glycosyltransferase family 2 protein [Candidatus Levybacteria bacterium]
MINSTINKIFLRYPRKSIRLLEIIPPLIAVFLITVPFWGSFAFPVFLSYLIIFFDIYWLYKSLNLAVCSFFAARKIKQAEQTDWMAQAVQHQDFDKVRHIAVIPTYKESVHKLMETIDSIQGQTFPTHQLYVFVAFEEREEEAYEKAKILDSHYKNVFGGIYSTFHPDVANEVKGKSSNQAYAAREANRILVEEKGLDISFMTISSVDADSIFDEQYFAYLTHEFLSHKNRDLAFFQSANVYFNNFWKVPAGTRVIAFFGSLSRASLLVQPLRLIPNSTYTLSFKLLKDIGYWDTDVIPEDYRTFFKAFFAKKGRVTVDPIFLKTSMDSPQSMTYFGSLMNKYQQERRWSWGISDDAVFLKWWLTVKDVPFLKKTYLVSNVIFDHIMWPVNWFLITIAANLVVILNPVFSRTSLGYTLPHLSGFILTICLFALFVMIYVDFDLRSNKFDAPPKMKQFMFPLEFMLMPIAGLFLSTIPALMSHVQLIRGKRLEYKVTEKV